MWFVRHTSLLAAIVLSALACDRQVSTVNERNASRDAEAGGRPKTLSLEDSRRVDEIAIAMKLTEQEKAILTDLLERNHPAVKPLHKLITEMDGRLAPYLKDKWILFSEHAGNLLAKSKALLGHTDSDGRPLSKIEIVGIGTDSPPRLRQNPGKCRDFISRPSILRGILG